MTDDNSTDSTDTADTSTDAAGTDATDWKAEAEKYKSLARKHEERAKGNATAAKELEKLREATLTEQEKAVVAARSEAAAEAARASAPRLVRAELRAVAAETGLGREALDGFLEYADLSRFVTDDGSVDEKAIAAAVKKLGPSGRRTDFDGGARTPVDKPGDMNSFIRERAGLS